MCVDEPAIMARAEKLRPERVLEVGCATGVLTEKLAALASELVAIDRSPLMIERAKDRAWATEVSLVCSDAVDYQDDRSFDLVVSSMTAHLIDDFSRFARFAYTSLREGGTFLFSQRHPIRTANPNGCNVTNNEPHWNVGQYFTDGLRSYKWLEADVFCFHRSIETIVSSLVREGFEIREIVEPLPFSVGETERTRENLSTPSVLLLNARK